MLVGSSTAVSVRSASSGNSIGSAKPGAGGSAVADFDSAMKSLFAKEKSGGIGGADSAHAPASQRNLLYATLGVACLVILLLFLGSGSGGSGGVESVRGAPSRFPERFRIAVIADLDKKSKVKDANGKDVWHSVYQTVSRNVDERR